MRFLFAVASLACAAAAPVALAETPEETIAYVFYGFASEAALDRGAMHLDWHEASSSPAVFVGHGEGGGRAYDVTFTITALSDCEYEVQLAGPPQMIRDGKTLYARIDLAGITGVTGGEFQVTIEGDGYCQTGQLNPNCTRVRETDLYGALDRDKHLRLAGQLRTEICVRP